MKLMLELVLRDEMGNIHARRVSEVPKDVAFKGERYADDCTGPFSAAPFHRTIDVIKMREFRKEALAEYCRNMGHELGVHLEDKEGWHGLDRQERIEQEYKRR